MMTAFRANVTLTYAATNTSGFSLYPFIDYNVLLRIQAEHDAQELLMNELTQSIVDNDYRLSLMELKGEK